MACVICEHPKRKEIEEFLLFSNFGNDKMTLADIAQKFSVKLEDLQVHALMHTPLSRLEDERIGVSIAAELKKSEAAQLNALAEEYWVTLRSVGADIRKTVADKNNGGARMLTKQVVDLYIGTGTGLRQTIESIVDMNQKLNGEVDSGTKALADIVNAIRGVER